MTMYTPVPPSNYVPQVRLPRKSRVKTTVPEKHGTRSGYRIHGCRCDKCVEWNNARGLVENMTPHRRAHKLQAQRIRQGIEGKRELGPCPVCETLFVIPRGISIHMAKLHA